VDGGFSLGVSLNCTLYIAEVTASLIEFLNYRLGVFVDRLGVNGQ
jgi:hypothetical protein